MEEFKDFAAYVQKCDKAAGKSAIFKVSFRIQLAREGSYTTLSLVVLIRLA
jgi:hypothetical protein